MIQNMPWSIALTILFTSPNNPILHMSKLMPKKNK